MTERLKNTTANLGSGMPYENIKTSKLRRDGAASERITLYY